jgi:hypothetical protein
MQQTLFQDQIPVLLKTAVTGSLFEKGQFKHKLTGQIMTIERMHGNIATCKLLIPVPSKVIIHKQFNDVTICNINNLEKI